MATNEILLTGVPVHDISIEAKDVLKLWSCNSACGDRYVQMKAGEKDVHAQVEEDVHVQVEEDVRVVNASGEVEEDVHVVNASGEVEEASTNITFEQVNRFPRMYNLTFKDPYGDGRTYYLNATETDVTASKDPNDEPFQVIELWYPNSEYVVLRSNMKADNKFLYLSSDGAGKMKLKASGDVHTRYIEPALLFRVVKPQ